jgi:hypothetical protein
MDLLEKLESSFSGLEFVQFHGKSHVSFDLRGRLIQDEKLVPSIFLA